MGELDNHTVVFPADMGTVYIYRILTATNKIPSEGSETPCKYTFFRSIFYEPTAELSENE
jgi:hypothetical protein